MHKMMIIAALVAATAGSLMAEQIVKVESIATVADTTVTTNYIDIADFTIGYRDIDKIVVKNNGAATATSVITICDEPAAGAAYAVFTPLATYAVATGASTNDFPLRAGSYGSTSNYVQYSARRLRVITTLASTNAVQANNDFYIYGRK